MFCELEGLVTTLSGLDH